LGAGRTKLEVLNNVYPPLVGRVLVRRAPCKGCAPRAWPAKTLRTWVFFTGVPTKGLLENKASSILFGVPPGFRWRSIRPKFPGQKKPDARFFLAPRDENVPDKFLVRNHRMETPTSQDGKWIQFKGNRPPKRWFPKKSPASEIPAYNPVPSRLRKPSAKGRALFPTGREESTQKKGKEKSCNYQTKH